MHLRTQEMIVARTWSAVYQIADNLQVASSDDFSVFWFQFHRPGSDNG